MTADVSAVIWRMMFVRSFGQYQKQHIQPACRSMAYANGIVICGHNQIGTSIRLMLKSPFHSNATIPIEKCAFSLQAQINHHFIQWFTLISQIYRVFCVTL